MRHFRGEVAACRGRSERPLRLRDELPAAGATADSEGRFAGRFGWRRGAWLERRALLPVRGQGSTGSSSRRDWRGGLNRALLTNPLLRRRGDRMTPLLQRLRQLAPQVDHAVGRAVTLRRLGRVRARPATPGRRPAGRCAARGREPRRRGIGPAIGVDGPLAFRDRGIGAPRCGRRAARGHRSRTPRGIDPGCRRRPPPPRCPSPGRERATGRRSTTGESRDSPGAVAQAAPTGSRRQALPPGASHVERLVLAVLARVGSSVEAHVEIALLVGRNVGPVRQHVPCSSPGHATRGRCRGGPVRPPSLLSPGGGCTGAASTLHWAARSSTPWGS